MQTETTTPSDDKTRPTSPRSAKRMLMYFTIGIIGSLALIILLIALFYSPGPTPLEQKLLGRWVCYPSYGNRTYYTFLDDGTVVIHDESSPSSPLIFQWSAAGNRMHTYEDHWFIHVWNRLTGNLKRTPYEVLLHDENTLELYNGTPTRGIIFHRIKE